MKEIEKEKKVKTSLQEEIKKMNEITYPFLILLCDNWICQKKKKEKRMNEKKRKNQLKIELTINATIKKICFVKDTGEPSSNSNLLSCVHFHTSDNRKRLVTTIL